MTPGSDTGPWRQRGFLAAGGLIAVLVVLGVMLALTAGDGDGDGPPAVSNGAARPAPETRTPASSSACGLPDGSQDVPTDTPANTRWELVGKMAAPTAPKRYGPGRLTRGIRTCFAHNPMGALYAAVNVWASAWTLSTKRLYDNLAAPSTARDAGIRRKSADEVPESSPGLQVAGFRFVSYSSDRATIGVAFRLRDGAIVEIVTTLLWRDRGDWRFEVPLDQKPPMTQLDSLEGFVPWSGA